MGSTAPDIRVITRWERERTHFFDLGDFSEQDGRAAFFASYPFLAEGTKVSAPTAAFVAGYLTHLVMDEMWITEMYRPHFGERSPLGGDLRANLMDRALQFSMDCERRSNSELMAHIVDAVARCDLALDIGLVDSETLRHWHEVVIEMMRRPADWQRFREGARRHLANGQSWSEDLQDLMESLPDLVQETMHYLTRERVDEFLAGALERSLAAVKDYLECA